MRSDRECTFEFRTCPLTMFCQSGMSVLSPLVSSAYSAGGLLVVIGGVAFATQGGVNSRLARTPGSNPAFSSLQSFIVGTLCCFVFTLIWSRGFHGINVKLAFQEGPWWQWMGGFLGATVLVVNVLEIPRLGAGTVSGVLVCSMVIFVGSLSREGVDW